MTASTDAGPNSRAAMSNDGSEPEPPTQMTLPQPLVDAYILVLDRLGLLEQARVWSKVKKLSGGESEEESRMYFGGKFCLSAARSATTAEDPTGALRETNRLLRRVFSGARLAMLDVPSGSGASSLSVLAVVADLRRRRLLPCIPMRIHLYSADISKHALQYLDELFPEVRKSFAEVMLDVRLETSQWDASKSWETSSLMERLLHEEPAESRLVLMSNFSDASTRDFETRFKSSFITIRDRLLDRPDSVWVHIEPARFSRQEKLFGYIKELLAERFGNGKEGMPPGAIVEQCEIRFLNPLTSEGQPCNVSVASWLGRLVGDHEGHEG